MRFLILFLCLYGQVFAQIQYDSTYKYLARQIVEQMYSWEFDSADSNLAILAKKYPNHPAIPFASGMILYWKSYPTADESQELKAQFDKFELATRLADQDLKINPDNSEVKYIRLVARSMIMRYYAEFGHYLSALAEARNLYSSTLEGMKLQDQFPDFNLTSGIYYYYREFYPENFPVYKPFMSFFKRGNKELGLKLISKSARDGVFCIPEALSFDAHVRLRFEKDKKKGYELYVELARKYPNNMFFQLSLGEAAILNQDWQTTALVCEKIENKATHPIYKGYLHIFRGYLAENNNEIDLAEKEFVSALKLIASMGKPLYQHDTFIYAALSRIYNAKQDKQKANYFAKKAINSDALDIIQAFDLLKQKE